MTSKFIEDIHLNLLKQLIEDSGLECVKSPSESVKSEILEVETEEDQQEEEEKPSLETAVEEEQIPEEEEFKEEEPAIFPTPSLRRILPDKIRQIEEQNRVHVLPKNFKTEIDPTDIPKIASTPQYKCIDILGEIVGCKNYKSSLAEYWFLDTLGSLLRRAQKDELNKQTQAVLILWFCEWMKEIQQFDAADRQRMLKRFQEIMLAAANFIAENEYLPTPAEADVHYESLEELAAKSAVLQAPLRPEPSVEVTFAKATFACSLRDLAKIIHYIYDLFSTDFQFDLVRSVFTFTPDYVLIDSPYQLQNPKRMYEPLKISTKDKSPKKEDKDKKGKKKEVYEADTKEYLALMELKAKEERELEEQDLRERTDYNLRSHILPLNFAATEELFNKYWPPPTPEPEPEPEIEVVKGKGKGKGKK